MAHTPMTCTAVRQQAPNAVVPSTVRQKDATMIAVHTAGTTAALTKSLSGPDCDSAITPNATSIQRLYGRCPANHRSSAAASGTRRAGADAITPTATSVWIARTKHHDSAAVATRAIVTR